MKYFSLLHAVTVASLLTACAINEARIVSPEPESAEPTVAKITGTSVIKVDENLAAILEQAEGQNSVQTKSESINGAFSELGAYKFERVFPDAGKYEERTRREGMHLFYTVEYDKSVSYTKAGEILSAVEGVTKVETPRKIKRRSIVPDDPYFKYQWDVYNDKSLNIYCSLNNSTIRYTNKGADLNLSEIWENYTTGDSRVIVNVVDGGVDIDHPDLEGVVIPGGKDGSKDFVENTYKITGDDHGTHVAGTIAAVRNNGIGVAGIAGGDYAAGVAGVKILSSQIFLEDYGASDSQTANALKWGADHGALISQNSWGYYADENEDGNVSSSELAAYKKETIPEYIRIAIDYFIKYAGCDNDGNQETGSMMKGGLVIFAAGNEDIDYDPICDYDAVISVSAGTAGYTKAYYSNYGSWIDICAPGGDGLDSWALSTSYFGDKDSQGNSRGQIYNLCDGSYTYMSGTSMACPHVSGVAALIVSYFGGVGYTNVQARKALLEGANSDIVADASKTGPWVDLKGSFDIGGKTSFIAPETVTDFSLTPLRKAMDISFAIPADPDEKRAAGVVMLMGTSKDRVSNSTANYPQSGVNRYVFETEENADAGDVVNTTISNLRHGTTYYVAFFAYDKSHNYSPMSEIKSGKTPDNHAPTLKETPSDLILYGIGSVKEFELGDIFVDEDEDELNFRVSTSDNNVVKITTSQGHAKLTANGKGETTMTFSADDGDKQTSITWRLLVKLDADDPVETYPNPVTTKLTISTEEEAETYVRIVSSSGKVVYESSSIFSGFDPLTVNTSDLSPGRYSVTIQYSGKTFHKTIVKV